MKQWGTLPNSLCQVSASLHVLGTEPASGSMLCSLWRPPPRSHLPPLLWQRPGLASDSCESHWLLDGLSANWHFPASGNPPVLLSLKGLVPLLGTYGRFDFGDLYNEVDACCCLRDGLPARGDAPADPVTVPLAVLQVLFVQKFRPVTPAFVNLPRLLSRHVALRFPLLSGINSREVLKRS